MNTRWMWWVLAILMCLGGNAGLAMELPEDGLAQLPAELVAQVGGYLSYEDMINLACTDRYRDWQLTHEVTARADDERKLWTLHRQGVMSDTECEMLASKMSCLMRPLVDVPAGFKIIKRMIPSLTLDREYCKASESSSAASILLLQLYVAIKYDKDALEHLVNGVQELGVLNPLPHDDIWHAYRAYVEKILIHKQREIERISGVGVIKATAPIIRRSLARSLLSYFCCGS